MKIQPSGRWTMLWLVGLAGVALAQGTAVIDGPNATLPGSLQAHGARVLNLQARDVVSIAHGQAPLGEAIVFSVDGDGMLLLPKANFRGPAQPGDTVVFLRHAPAAFSAPRTAAPPRGAASSDPVSASPMGVSTNADGFFTTGAVVENHTGDTVNFALVAVFKDPNEGDIIDHQRVSVELAAGETRTVTLKSRIRSASQSISYDQGLGATPNPLTDRRRISTPRGSYVGLDAEVRIENVHVKSHRGAGAKS